MQIFVDAQDRYINKDSTFTSTAGSIQKQRKRELTNELGIYITNAYLTELK